MLTLFYGGSEIPGHRTLLAEQGVTNMSLSYIGLRRRLKHTERFSIEAKYPEDTNVFLDSGAFTLNGAQETYSDADLQDFYFDYKRFVEANIEHVSMVSEFDALKLGPDAIETMRYSLAQIVPPEKFVVMWHPLNGLDELRRLCEIYQRVGVPRTALGERDLAPVLNGLVASHGVKLHGVAMTKPDVMREVRWDTVSSTSWLSPSQFGDTIIWTGQELKRYPKAYKEQARKRHRTQITSAGFDAQAIEDDDRKEVLRLSIWSWERTVEALNRHGDGNIVSGSPNPHNVENAEHQGGAVDTSGGQTRNFALEVVHRDSEDMLVIPSLGLREGTENYQDENGLNKTRPITLVETRSASERICDTCFLKNKCPAFKEQSNCAYDMPINIKTRDQYRSLRDTVISMQAQRVFFMKTVEDREGGYVDPNLSNEIDRLAKMMKAAADEDSDSFSLTISAKQSGSGQAGLVGRLFGADASEAARALPAPIDTDLALQSMGVVYDAEVLHES